MIKIRCGDWKLGWWALGFIAGWTLMGCGPSHYRHNYMEHRTEYAEPDWNLRYNWQEGEWQYAPSDAHLGYNYQEKRWEFKK